MAEEDPQSLGADGAAILAFRARGPSANGQISGKEGGKEVGKSAPAGKAQAKPAPPIVGFERGELRAILDLYARKVAEGAWRDYAIDFGREAATFSVFRRASEGPLYRIEKAPKLARAQGAYAVVAATGRILKRGHDLARVLAVLDPRLALVR